MRPPAPQFPERLRGVLSRLNTNQVLDGSDVAVVRTLTTPETPKSVIQAIALVSMARRLGHSCIDLDDTTHLEALLTRTDASSSGEAPARVEVPDHDLPDVDDWVATLASSVIVETASGSAPLELDRPLVLDVACKRLWFSRYAAYEQRLAEGLLRLAQAPGNLADASSVETEVDAVFGPAPEQSVPQRAAVTRALTNRLTFITGGPGTGKTYTVARLVEAASRPGLDGPDVIALAAPTGKAAERLTEAVAGDHTGTTIHRLLGLRPGTIGRPDDSPLLHRLVIVDEVSMIDLPLMTHLIEAVGDRTHLVLVGDPDQLASVEVGTVLRDVVDTSASSTSPLHGTVVRLDVVHRQESDSPIIDLAEAIRVGDATKVLALLDGSKGSINRVEPDSSASRAALDEAIAAATDMVDAARSGDAEAAIAGTRRHRILAATRSGPGGLTDWSRRIRHGVGFREGEWVAGRPVIVTRNDSVNGVSNGDTGIAVPSEDGSNTVRVAFMAGEVVRYLAPTALRDVEDWWAMTIHKSQGSEYDHVVVSLPTRSSPILTRELLYTAVTRAKTSVTIIAPESSITEAITRPVARASGLVDRLAN